MASLNVYLNAVSVFGDGGLLPVNGRRRLDSCTEDDIAAVTDAAQNPAGMIGQLQRLSIRRLGVLVIIVMAKGLGNGKSVSDLKAFDCPHGADGLGQIGV